MKVRLSTALSCLLAASAAARSDEIVIDFEQAEIGKPLPTWKEHGVVFKLAGPLTQSKAAGRIMFFPHIPTNRKGILNAMATEQAIPLEATFPAPASSVTLVLWGSTGCPVLLEALGPDGDVVDKVEVAAVPGRKAPAEPIPFLELAVKAPAITGIRLSGPRNGEFLAADEIRIEIAATR